MGKSVEDYTKEIEESIHIKDVTYLELEKLSVAIINKSIEVMEKQIKKEIENAVKYSPEHTKELNDAGRLKEVKEKMNTALENISDYVEEEFLNDKVFLHRSLKPERNKYSFEYSDDIKKKSITAYRAILGYAGKIICEYGYDKAGNDFNGHSKWQYISGTGGKMKYGYGMDIRVMDKEWKEYFDLFNKFVDTVQQIDKLTEEKDRTEAVGLWESI